MDTMKIFFNMSHDSVDELRGVVTLVSFYVAPRKSDYVNLNVCGCTNHYTELIKTVTESPRLATHVNEFLSRTLLPPVMGVHLHTGCSTRPGLTVLLM